MSSNITIVGFTGSTRVESHNKAALRLAQELLPANATLEILDIEALAGDEDAARDFNGQLQQADALFIATPEYKGLLSRVLKNALSLVTPGALAGKPTAIIGIGKSNGEGREHELLRARLAKLNAAVLDEQVSIASSQLADETTRQQIRALFAALVERVEDRVAVLAR